MAVPVPLLDQNPCRTSCNWRLAHRRVSMSASTTFHRVSSRPMPRLYVIPVGMRTKTVHPNSCGISPVCHMCWTMSTRHIHHFVCGGIFESSLEYTYRIHCFKCSAWRWVCLPALKGRRRKIAASTSAFNGVLSLTWTGSTCVARGMPGSCGSLL